MFWLRILAALVATQILAGISAGLSNRIVLGSNEHLGFVFATFGAIIIIPAVLLAEGLLIFIQMRLSHPSLALQVGGSLLAAIALSSYIVYAFEYPGDMARFMLLVGGIGGATIGLAWYFIVTVPMHPSTHMAT